ncbi:MAG TPA: DNA mismatch repair endonuclease MutL, partial [Longimicrobiaceae bacterium]|nr:DNA mismatch repair endonuclease MutL [Longimicrobiaceae bacterium]
VARLSLETAERDGDGTRVLSSGGRVTGVEGCARRRGTTVAVRTLFFNVPARAKFLRSAAAETRAVGEVVTTLALAHPEIAFRLESNGRELLDLPAAPELRARIAAVWGQEAADELIPVAHAEGGVALSGLVQRPRSAKPGARRAYLFVNGRAFSDRMLVRAATRAYRTVVAPGVNPSLFLYLDVPDGAVDVNVHPTKAEVRFRDGILTERVVEEGVRGALKLLQSAPSLGRGAVAAALAAGLTNGRHAAPQPPATSAAADEAPPLALTMEPEPAQQMTLFVSGVSAPPEPGVAAASAPVATAGAQQAAGSPVTAAGMWQIHNTYILAETRDGLIIVDQHSAHERVLYEELMGVFGGAGQESQRLLFPLTLRLSPAEFALIEDLQSLLGAAGFEIEPFGGRAIIVHAVPNPHPYFDAERCLREMVAELTNGSPLVDPVRNQHQRIALSFACKAAIKAGQKLSAAEMAELFDRLFATELPYHDVHGRPTIVQLPLSELHNRFNRHG